NCAALTGATIARNLASTEPVVCGGGAAPINPRQLRMANLRIATLPLIDWRNWHLLIARSSGAAIHKDSTRTRKMLRSIDHFIGGSSFASGERQAEVFDPNQGQVQAQVRLGTANDLEKAMDAARAAQPAWAATNPQRRARV